MTDLGFYALAFSGGLFAFGLLVFMLVHMSENSGKAAQRYKDDEQKLVDLKKQAQDIADQPKSDDDVLRRLRADADRAD